MGIIESDWSAPDRSGLLKLDTSSIWSDPEGSRRIVWMIKPWEAAPSVTQTTVEWAPDIASGDAWRTAATPKAAPDYEAAARRPGRPPCAHAVALFRRVAAERLAAAELAAVGRDGGVYSLADLLRELLRQLPRSGAG